MNVRSTGSTCVRVAPRTFARAGDRWKRRAEWIWGAERLLEIVPLQTSITIESGVAMHQHPKPPGKLQRFRQNLK